MTVLLEAEPNVTERSARPELVEGLPESWTHVSIQDIATLNPRAPLAGLTPDSLVHFVPMSAVVEEFGGIDVSKLRQLCEVQKGYTSFSTNDVLFAKITPCMENGKTALVPPLSNQIGFGSTEFHVLRAERGIAPKWLAHYLSQAEFRRLARQNMTGSAGQMRVPTSWLSSTQIPLAPAAEQTRIVEKLEELLSDLDAGVAELKAAQKKLVQYRQSLLKAAVEGTLTAEWRERRKSVRTEPVEVPVASVHGSTSSPRTDTAATDINESGAQLLARILKVRRARWEAKQLAKFAEQGKAPPKGWQDKYPEPVKPDTTDLPTLPEGWVWASIDALLDRIETGKSFKCDERPPKIGEVGVVKVSAVSWGEYDEAESKTCINPAFVHAELFVRDGDFLFSRANTIELVGACVIATNVSKSVMLSDKILRFVLVDASLNNWLLTSLRSEIGRKQIELFSSGNQDSMRNIGQERIRQIAVPIPPKTELDFTLERIEAATLAASEQSSGVVHALKQSTAQRKNILKAAFSGKLVPQEPTDEPASALLARIQAERSEVPYKALRSVASRKKPR